MTADEVLRIADSGNGYLACERSLIVVRKFKKRNELNEAMIFLMELAHCLARSGQWIAAITSARRSIQMFPKDSTTIRTYLKQLFFQFVEILTPDAVTPDLFVFFASLMCIFPASCNQLVERQAQLAEAAKMFFLANKYYHHLWFLFQSPAPDSRPPNIAPFAWMLCQWVHSLPESIRITQGQFIICRAILAMAASGVNTLSIARNLCSQVKSLASDFEWAGIIDRPMFHCTEFCLEALEKKHDSTLKMLMEKYDRILKVDSEIMEFLRKAHKIHIQGNNRTDAETAMNRFMNFLQTVVGTSPSPG
jgi:hypothetical protein